MEKEKIFITAENIVRLAELVAYKVLRTSHAMMGSNSRWNMLKSLRVDFYNKNTIGYAFSSAYDLVQIAIAFYCEHLGKSLTTIIVDQKDKPVSIYTACCRLINKEIYQFARTSRCIDFDEELISSDSDSRQTIQQLENVDTLIDELKLTQKQFDALKIRMMGRGYMTLYNLNNKQAANIIGHCKNIQIKYKRFLRLNGKNLEQCSRCKTILGIVNNADFEIAEDVYCTKCERQLRYSQNEHYQFI